MKLVLGVISALTLFFASACGNTVTNTTIAPAYRWMDRTLYFAYSNAAIPERNNEFQKSKIQDALNDIALNSNLGANYFNYQELDESVLTPSLTQSVSADEFKSFILIWPDADFSDFVVNQLGGMVPDPNAITVLNAAYKKKFYMIFKASCFESSSACNFITEATGLRALVARQIGLMTGLSIKNCTSFPNDTMCASAPNDIQWSPTNKQQWLSSLNNVLEAILNNPDFYNEYIIPATQ